MTRRSFNPLFIGGAITAPRRRRGFRAFLRRVWRHFPWSFQL